MLIIQLPTSNVRQNANHTIFIQFFKKLNFKIENAAEIFSFFFQPQIEFCTQTSIFQKKNFACIF